ncbi:hypothetical protein K0A97_00010 [Patescibacteria group bacterium]|nr:hypothetical protein [Patescibacteria group bacterium]
MRRATPFIFIASLLAVSLAIFLFPGFQFTGLVIFDLENISPVNNSSFEVGVVNFSISLDDNESVIKNVSLIINDSIWDTNNSGLEGVYNWTVTDLENGEYNWSILVFDLDNESYSTGIRYFFINLSSLENSVPENDSITYGNEWSGAQFYLDNFEFEINESENYSWLINYTPLFDINSTGFLINNFSLGVWEYYLLVTLNNSQGENYSLVYNLNVTPAQPPLSISFENSTIEPGDRANVRGLGCPQNQSNLTCVFYRDGTAVSNPDTTRLYDDDEYFYVYNTTGNQNYTSYSKGFTLTVKEALLEENEISEEMLLFPPLEEIITPVIAIGADSISSFELIQGDSQEISWKVKNTGNTELNSCLINVTGNYSDWVYLSEEDLQESFNLTPDEYHTTYFNITVPGDAEEGEYSFTAKATCTQKSVSKGFTLTVKEKKLELKIIEVEKVRDDSVKVVYRLEEIKGRDQDVKVNFSLLELNGEKISFIEDERSIRANSSKDFKVRMTVDESLEGEVSLMAEFNSEIYSGSLKKAIFLSAPLGGFVIFDELSTEGNILLVVGVLLFLLVSFFIVRKIRTGKFLNKPLFKKKGKKLEKNNTREKRDNLKEEAKNKSEEKEIDENKRKDVTKEKEEKFKEVGDTDKKEYSAEKGTDKKDRKFPFNLFK